MRSKTASGVWPSNPSSDSPPFFVRRVYASQTQGGGNIELLVLFVSLLLNLFKVVLRRCDDLVFQLGLFRELGDLCCLGFHLGLEDLHDLLELFDLCALPGGVWVNPYLLLL